MKVNRTKKRTTIYLNSRLRAKASVLMEVEDFGDNLTGFVEQLIREKWEARGGDAVLGKMLKPEPVPEKMTAVAEPPENRTPKPKRKTGKKRESFGSTS